MTKPPIVSQVIDLAQFALDYGYDATEWELSRERIMQGLSIGNKMLYAECRLSRLLRIAVRDYSICKGTFPDEKLPKPEDIKCVEK
jgi:hypothetical protein